MSIPSDSYGVKVKYHPWYSTFAYGAYTNRIRLSLSR